MKTLSSDPRSRAWLVVGLLWVVGCLNYIDRVMLTTMHDSVTTAIPMNEAQFGLLTTAFLLVYAVLSPVAGFLADRFNRSRVILISLIAWSLITWLTAHAQTYGQLLASRLLMGVSEACYMPAALALVADYHRGRTLSLATGVLLGGVMIGSAMGGLGGWLADRHHWSFAFQLFGSIGIAFAVPLGLFLRDPSPCPEDQSSRAAPAPLIRPAETAWSLLRNRSYQLAFLYWGLLGIAGWMVIGWMPVFLQERFQLSQGTAGMIATVYVNVASLVGLVVGGAWSDRWSRTNPSACLFVAIIGLLGALPCILAVAHTGTLAVAIVGLVIYGLLIAFANAEMMPILCLVLDSRYLATGFGILNFFSCAVGGATTYAGGALRDSKVNLSHLFEFGAAGLALCAGLLFCIRPKPEHPTPGAAASG